MYQYTITIGVFTAVDFTPKPNVMSIHVLSGLMNTVFKNLSNSKHFFGVSFRKLRADDPI